MLDYIDKNYSMRKTFICGAMKPVSLLFDQPTYMQKNRFSHDAAQSLDTIGRSRSPAVNYIICSFTFLPIFRDRVQCFLPGHLLD